MEVKVLVANPPWSAEGRKGVRAGSRWPHLKIPEEEGYMPFPFYMGYTKSLLKDHGFSCKLIDAIAENITLDQFYQRVRDGAFTFIVLEVSTPSMHHDLEIIQKIKNISNATIAIVGPDNSVGNKTFLNDHPEIDLMMYGEYEQTVLEISFCLKNKWSLENVSGLIYRKEGIATKNPPRKLDYDLNNYPWPDREELPMHKYNDRPGGIPEPSAQMWGSRGCPFKCSFCLWPQLMSGGKYRPRDAIKIVDEIEHLVRNEGYRSYYFDDDTFNIGKQRMLKIGDEIIRRGLEHIPWAFMGRADLVDEEIISKLKKAGLHAVKYGVESANQKLVDNINKSLNVEKVRESVKLTKKYGIKIHLTFSFGLPGETKETIQQTINFARELNPDSLQFSIMTPFPGTKYHHELSDRGEIVSLNLEDYDGNQKAVIRTETLSPTDLVEAQQRAYDLWAAHKEHLRKQNAMSVVQRFMESYKVNGLSFTLAKSRTLLKNTFITSKKNQKQVLHFHPQWDHGTFQKENVLGNYSPARHKLIIHLSRFNFHSLSKLMTLLSEKTKRKYLVMEEFSLLPFATVHKRFTEHVAHCNELYKNEHISFIIDDPKLTEILTKYEQMDSKKEELTTQMQMDLEHNMQIVLGIACRHLFVGPKVFHLDISNACNMDCVFCWWHSPTIRHKFTNKWRMDKIEYSTFKKVVDDIEKIKIRSLLLSGPGDPLTHPHITEMFSYLKDRDFRVSLFTNGLLFTEKMIDTLVDAKIFEVHWNIGAATPKTYKLVHPRQSQEDFYRTQQLIHYLNRRKNFERIPRIVMVNVITNLNYKEVAQMVDFANEMNIDTIKISLFEIEPENSHLMLDEEQMEEFRALIRIAKIRAEQHGIWIDTSIDYQVEHIDAKTGTWNMPGCFAGYNYSRRYIGQGASDTVSFCCAKKLIPGTKENFKEMWHSKEYQQFRDVAVVYDRKKNAVCSNDWHLLDHACDNCGNYQGNKEMMDILTLLQLDVTK